MRRRAGDAAIMGENDDELTMDTNEDRRPARAIGALLVLVALTAVHPAWKGHSLALASVAYSPLSDRPA